VRLLAYSHNFQREGAPIVLFRLLRALRDRHDIHLVALKRPEEPLVEEYRRIGIPLVGRTDLTGYDAMLVNTLPASAVVMHGAEFLPVLWWIHEPRMGLRYMAEESFDMRAFAQARRIVFPTSWQAETLYRNWLTGDNWRVVPYGIGTDTTPLACPFTREPGKLYLLQLGTVDERKGYDISIEALRQLADPGIQLFCLGRENAYPPYYEAIRHRWPHVHFLGSQPEAVVNAWLQHCDALLFPTRDDLITLSILEAMTFATCVIASDFGPIPEVIRHGESGLLSPVNDVAALAANIARIRHDPALSRRLGEAGRRVLRQNFAFEDHVNRMETELSALAVQ
jgi:glycosyltransferase involved in cell wall biosynthesis